MLAELKQYGQMALGIRKVLQSPVPKDPEEIVRQRLRERERTFLNLARRVIFANPNNPYVAMFQIAGCTEGDLAAEVERYGLKPTLVRLREAGIYLLHEEFKGRQPIVRNGREIPGTIDDFRNHGLRAVLVTSSGGSTGQPVHSPRSLEARIHGQVYRILEWRAFEMEGAARVLVRSILPSHIALTDSIFSHRWNGEIEHWFSEGSNLPTFREYQLLTWGMLQFARLHGARVKYPDYLPIDDFSPVVYHLARLREAGRRRFVAGNVSQLVRVAGDAIDRGVDISGSVFLCSGEALTTGKHELFARAGVRAYAKYSMSELSRVGIPCPECQGNTMHVLEDNVEAIDCRRPSPYDESMEVNSLHFTTLSAHAHVALINFEVDDAGELIPARCNCLLSRLGYKTLVTNVSSYGKVSPLGMTFHSEELHDILDRQLPARFGGGPGDYQLVECEGPNSQTQLVLYVSPRVRLTDTAAAGQFFLELVRPRYGGALATRAWVHAGGIKCIVAEPYKTSKGKVHPVRLLASTATCASNGGLGA